MPLGPDAVDPDRDRHRPVGRDRLDRRIARRVLVLGLHRILEVEDHEIGRQSARLLDRARVGRRQEQQRPHCEQVDVAFHFRSAHHRRIMRRNRLTGEEVWS